MTHTVAELALSPSAYQEIKRLLVDAGYQHTFMPDGMIDMSGIGVTDNGQDQSFDPVRDVEDFHRKFEINYDGLPRVLDFETMTFRLKFIREEEREYEGNAEAALFMTNDSQSTLDLHDRHRDSAELTYRLAETLDALVDMVYVVLGTAHLHGFPFREAWKRVHAANMAKGKNPAATDANNQMKMKIVKPEGWQPPRHEDLVENHAHREVK